MDDQNQLNDNSLVSTDNDQLAVGGLGTPPSNDDSDSFSPPSHDQPSDETSHSQASSSNSADDLDDIRQQAISKLTPLVKQLDQNPEERFKTILMLIQASDNRDLIHEAYEAADEISDEKSKAQALLDIVNEINYFTHKAD